LASPSALIDLSKLPALKGFAYKDDVITIGAMTSHADVAASALILNRIPALAELAASIGDPSVRNRGTIGGSVANNDPAADYPAAVLALNATVNTNKRKIAADDFFKGMFETALEAGEIVTAVSFPKPDKAAYAKFPQPASRFAMVGVFVSKSGNNVRVAVTGAGPKVFRQADMEKALAASFSADALKNVKQSAASLNSDIHGSADYRAHLVGVMARRAVEGAK
jgi:carbon-monoxide dehydrogenase medium subunit